MSIKPNDSQEIIMRPGQARNAEWAYRSLTSASQQRLFQRTLDGARDYAEEAHRQEINSLRKEFQTLQPPPMEQRATSSPRQNPIHDPSSRESGKGAGAPAEAFLDLAGLCRQMQQWRIDNAVSIGAGPVSEKPQLRVGSQVASCRRGETRDTKDLSGLSAQFESGLSGVAAVGYDERGGTSYGLYQISSRAGTMERFLDHLEKNAPQWAERLRAAGPSNTLGCSGRMPEEWRKIAAEDPVHFAELQRGFIEETHYTPALREILNRTGDSIVAHSQTLQQVLWSTAVQHGPKGAADIFCRAVDQVRDGEDEISIRGLIDRIYGIRAKQFRSSPPAIREAVHARFETEKAMALSMLQGTRNMQRLNA